jgi:3-hydroxyacyl-[acyl-carrier-protein] dehydratase
MAMSTRADRDHRGYIVAATPFLDLSTIDVERVLVAREQIYQRLPHRYEFMQLDAICHIDKEQRIGVGRREILTDEFWVKGHIPGRPLFPGVLMIETAAHLACYLYRELEPGEGFLGFSGVDGVKFRGIVSPPARMIFIVKAVDVRKRRFICDTQGLVNGQLVFEAQITGMPF